MAEDLFSIEEEIAIGRPFSFASEDAQHLCDARGCLRPASLLLPEAWLCEQCLKSFGVGDGLPYGFFIPYDQLDLDLDDQAARQAAYSRHLERLRERVGGRVRDAEDERFLQHVAAVAVDELIAEIRS